jgi:hypothetical protein
MDIDDKMRSLGAKVRPGRVDPTAEMLAAFEDRFELRLPESYRQFLARYGAMTIDAVTDFHEPTPLGRSISIAELFGFMDAPKGLDIASATNIIEGHGLCVPIAESPFGDWFVLLCSGGRSGEVFLRDHEQRHEWPDEDFSRFPSLDVTIESYLELRRVGTLPPPLSGTPGWYLIAKTFDEFLARCRPSVA